MRLVLVFISIICLNVGFSRTRPQQDLIDTNNFEFELLDKYLLEEINDYRKRKRMDTLIVDPTLRQAAEDHANYMCDNRAITNTQKSRNKRIAYDRVVFYGGTHSKVGENIQGIELDAKIKKAKGRLTYQKLAQEIFTLWKKNGQFNKNMTNPEYQVVYNSFVIKHGNLYICQVLATHPFIAAYDYEKGNELFVKYSKPCWACYRTKKKLDRDDAYIGWYTISNDSIYYWNIDNYGEKPNQVKSNFKKVFSGKGVIAVDVIHQTQFDCEGDPAFHNEIYHDGYYIKYIDAKAIKNEDLHPNKNVVKLYVGQVPAFRDTFYQVDFNYTKKRKPCFNNVLIFVNPDYLKPTEYFVIPEPSINMNREYVVQDSVEIRIPFKRNQTNEDTTIFEPLKTALDSLVAADHQIMNIYFTGVASIEGTEEANQLLFSRRGTIIEDYLKRYYPSIRFDKEFYENFDDFRSGLVPLGYRELTDYSDDSLRHWANLHKDDPAVYSLLDETRYSFVRIVYHDYIPIKEGSYGISVQRIKDLTADENFRELVPLYEYMANKAIKGDSLIGDSLMALEFPQKQEFSKLNWYQFILELNLTDHEVDYDRLNGLFQSGAIKTDGAFLEYRLLFNIFYRKEIINVSDFPEVHDQLRQKKEKAWIESLEMILGVEIGRYSDRMVASILVNNVLKMKFDVTQTYFICQYLIEWGYTAEPYLLLSKHAKRPGNIPKLYKQYLKLGYFLGKFNDKREWKVILRVMRYLSQAHPQDFCELFKWHEMGVRSLDYPEIAEIFCATCREDS